MLLPFIFCRMLSFEPAKSCSSPFCSASSLKVTGIVSIFGNLTVIVPPLPEAV